MNTYLRITSLAATVAAMALAATPASAQVAPSDRNATATARIIKPLTLTHVQDLNLGDILLSGGTGWTGAVVGITHDGSFDCSNVNVTCTGVPQVAMYNVTGTQGQTVTITSTPTVLMRNANDVNETLTLTVDNPGTVYLANSGAPGSDFSLGGSISVDADTLDGVYTGTFDVTVDY